MSAITLLVAGYIYWVWSLLCVCPVLGCFIYYFIFTTNPKSGCCCWFLLPDEEAETQKRECAQGHTSSNWWFQNLNSGLLEFRALATWALLITKGIEQDAEMMGPCWRLLLATTITTKPEQAWTPLLGWLALGSLEKDCAQVSRSQIQRVQVVLMTVSEALAGASSGLSRRYPPVRHKQNSHDCLVRADVTNSSFVWNALWALRRQRDWHISGRSLQFCIKIGQPSPRAHMNLPGNNSKTKICIYLCVCPEQKCVSITPTLSQCLLYSREAQQMFHGLPWYKTSSLGTSRASVACPSGSCWLRARAENCFLAAPKPRWGTEAVPLWPEAWALEAGESQPHARTTSFQKTLVKSGILAEHQYPCL